MKNWSTYIFLLVAGALSLLATSCSQEDEGLESVLVSNGKATVQFSIALGDSGAGSRSTDETWTPPYTPSDNGVYEFENEINLGQFHVNLIIPATDSTPSTTIPVKLISQLDNSDDHQYTLKGEVNIEKPKFLVGAKIEVFANVDDKNEPLFHALYSKDPQNADIPFFPGKGVEYMPMWGVHTITEDLLLTASNTINLTPTKPIYLLRSMAKVEVNFNGLPSKYKILDVSLSKHNTAGNVRPKGNYDYTTLYLREECINVPTDGESDFITVSPELAFINIEANRYIIYVPEFEFNTTDTNTDNNDLYIQVKIDKDKNDGKDVDASYTFKSEGKFSVVSNANGKNPNWVRNHWYVYNVNVDTDVNFNYEVVEWPIITNGSLHFGYADGNAHNRK